MFSPSKLVSLIAVAAAVVATPVSLQKRLDTSEHCGHVTASPYILYLNQWGSASATSGSDCATFLSLDGDVAAWTTTWQWEGGSGVKSYTNINLDEGLDVQLSSISSIPSTWTWSQSGTSSDIVANIAFDLFTSTSAGGSNEYEIMIWLANYNAGPISYTYGSDGSPTPVASNLSIEGSTWNLYYGSNGVNLVYSFLLTSGEATSFSADINSFLTYLTTEQDLPSSQYLVTAQGGTEATEGSATLDTSAFSIAIN